MWCIWRERNNRHFEDLEKKIFDLKLFFFKVLLDWVAVLGFPFFFFFFQFMVSWTFVLYALDLYFVLDVYFLYTQVTPLIFI